MAILKAERDEAAVQMRIADGGGFDPAGGIALRLPVALDLRRRLRRAADLWSVAEPDTEKAAAGASPTASSSRCSTTGSPAAACA